MAEVSDQLIERVLSRFETLQETVEESRREMVHMSACYQEQAARLDEFMRDHEARVRTLESTCPHNERWESNRGEHDRIWIKTQDLDARITKIERAKCPKSPSFDELDTRLKAVEDIHTKDSGVEDNTKRTREYVLYLIALGQFAVIVYQAMGGIS